MNKGEIRDQFTAAKKCSWCGNPMPEGDRPRPFDTYDTDVSLCSSGCQLWFLIRRVDYILDELATVLCLLDEVHAGKFR